jgi:hypothetical protein
MEADLERKEFAMFSLIVHGRRGEVMSGGDFETLEAAFEAGEHVKRFGVPAGRCPDR